MDEIPSSDLTIRAVDREIVKASVWLTDVSTFAKVNELTAKNPVTDRTRRRVRMFLSIFIQISYTKIQKNAKN